MNPFIEWTAAAVIVIAAFFLLVGAIGLVRLPDFYMRLHAPTKASTLGVGGVLIGFLATLSYLRVGPLGVTAELGSVARTAADGLGWLPERLEGLDSFSGCATAVKEALLSNNGLFILGLVVASWASALLAGDFQPKRPRVSELLRNLLGGVLLGWGSMLALGCTVGTLLSGIMAGALSGWVFAVFCLVGVLLGLRIRRYW